MSEAIIDVFRSLKLRDCGRPLPASAIADWERSIGLQLPENYRRFLEVFNGGKFYPKFRYRFPIDMSVHPSFWGNGIGGFTFYGLNEPWDWRDLEEIRDTHEGRIPAGTIPIADAPNDLVLLDCRRGGQIALWQRDHEGDTEPEDNRIPLADSFLEFAQGIQEAPPDCLRQLPEELPDDWVTAEEEPFISIQRHDLDGLKTWVWPLRVRGGDRRVSRAISGLLACPPVPLLCCSIRPAANRDQTGDRRYHEPDNERGETGDVNLPSAVRTVEQRTVKQPGSVVCANRSAPHLE
jgi:hypothetical protein